MAWLRLDDGFASHPKIAELTDRELRVWLRVLCYCARQQDPTVDEVAVREVKGLDMRTITRFSDVELLDESGADFEVHDWAHYQPKDATGAERQAKWRARRNAERNGSRNGIRNALNRYADRDENVTSRAGARARPVPSRPSKDQGAAKDVVETDRVFDDEPDVGDDADSPGISLNQITPDLRNIP